MAAGDDKSAGHRAVQRGRPRSWPGRADNVTCQCGSWKHRRSSSATSSDCFRQQDLGGERHLRLNSGHDSRIRMAQNIDMSGVLKSR